ncbi:hypothetical protein A3844_23850 [Paenibacillus helianthi]|uniref:SLH domain-containing protein n=1 Tax=Paenibacillus helianthi TaxID=1349432 RepID=A0ABX3ELA6_9BACL|nr:S-layer homology domain-containing protein [Paenibacillus helianthi]OKP82727.1 hypothetical protein A3844_23850 [Paenibacillus helianthi]
MPSKEEKMQHVNKILKITILTSQLISLNHPLYANAVSASKAHGSLDDQESTVGAIDNTYDPDSNYIVPVTAATYSSQQAMKLVADAFHLVGVSPNTSGTALLPVLSLFFNNRASLGNGELDIYSISDNSLVQRVFSSGGSIRVSGAGALITLPKALADDMGYYVTVSSGMFVDQSGQSFGGIQNPGEWSFWTVDQTAPVLLHRSPVGSGGMHPWLQMNFNEEVKLGTGALIIHKAGDGRIAGQIRVSGGTVWGGGSGSAYSSGVGFSTWGMLDSGSSYYVEVTSGLITDRTGNPYGGMSSPSAWTFWTTDPAPKVTGVWPNSGPNSGVSVNPKLRVQFSEAIQLRTGELEIHRQRDNQVVQRIPSSGGSVRVSGATAFISLLEPLADNTGYYVTASSGMFVDQAGQSFGGIQNPGEWSFWTVDQTAPVLLHRSPVGSGGMHPWLQMNFNEEVKLGTGALIIHKAGDGQIAGQIWVSGGTVWGGGSGSAYSSGVGFSTWGMLDSGSSYYVEVTSGLITDRTGNPYGGMSSPSAWTFWTSKAPILQPEVPGQNDSGAKNLAVVENTPRVDRAALIDTAKITEAKNVDSPTLIDIDGKTLGNVLVDLNNTVSGDNIVIDASKYGASIQINLPLRYFDGMVSKSDTMISIKSAYAQYLLPVELIKEWSLTYQADSLSITISALDSDIGKMIDDAASAQGVNLAKSGAVEFTIKAGDVEITDFQKTYVERKLLLNEALTSANATAAWYNPENGELQFVPSSFVVVDGHSEVSVLTDHNSIYTVISANKNFADMSNHWAKDDVELMANKLIIKGMTPDRFDPNRSITRSEFVALVVRGLGLKEKAQGGEFIDVSSDDWFAGSIGAAVEAGLVQGFGDHIFRPNDLITREEMAYISEKAIEYADSSERAAVSLDQLKYTDADSISTWAADSMAQAVNDGLMKGVTDEALAPKQKASRAEAASVIKRVLRFLKFIG